MKTVNYNELIIDKNENTFNGSFGGVVKCNYNNKTYAYKSFFDKEYLNGKIRKINSISNIDDVNLITPKYWVSNNFLKHNYLTEYCPGKDIGFDNENIIGHLKKVKEVIKKMHSYKIIHGDISSSNIMCDENDVYIIDFDNASYNNSPINIRDTNNYAEEYIKKIGVNNGLDVYLFNLLTFSMINDVKYYLVKREIINGNYGHFSDNYSKELCMSMFLDKSYSDKDYLIDAIDENKLII